MKAIEYTKYGSTDVLELTEVAKPSPDANQVLIKVHATTVTPVDIAFRTGTPIFARLFTGLFRPKKSILGTELSGEIEAIGAHVTRYKVGDQVFAAPADGNGAHAEYICLPQDGAIAHKPATLSHDEAASICNGALTALPFLRDNGKIAPGKRVLIIGASGSVGTFAVQIAKHFGAHVTGICSTANLDLVTSLGCDTVIDYTRTDFTKSNQKYDIIFDTVGKSSFAHSKRALTNTGIYLTTVMSISILFQMLWTSKVGSKKAVFAATGLRPAADQVADLGFLTKQIKAGKLKLIIDRSYPLEQIAEAYNYVEKGHKRGNVVITMAHRGPDSTAS